MGSILRQLHPDDLEVDELDNNFAEFVTQTGHGLTAGQAVYVDSSGDWQPAQANLEATLADAIVLAVVDANTVVIYNSSGIIDLTHGLGSPGQKVWLSQTVAGGLTVTQPSAGFSQYLGKTVATAKLLWAPRATELV